MSGRWANMSSSPALLTHSRELPNVPGLRRNTNPYIKARGMDNLNLKNARPGSSGMVRPSLSQPLLRGFDEAARPGTAGPPLASAGATCMSRSGPSTSRQSLGSTIPDYITKEKQVLRFFAYFQEAVHEGGSMDATVFRVRKFSIMYFLSDGSISIEEPREMNSGLTQGKFMRRTQVERPPNSAPLIAPSHGSKSKPPRGSSMAGGGVGVGPGPELGVGGLGSGLKGSRGIYTPEDFDVGKELWIYGRRFRIVDADANTRQWFKRSLGRPLGPAEEFPKDGYKEQRALFEVPSKRCV
ncbi:unnamed protein product [Discosporangium mesarthrocarpum]